MDYSTPFSARTQGEFFKAESAMLHFGDALAQKPYGAHMKETLLAIDAVFAVRMTSDTVIPPAPLVAAHSVTDWKFNGDVERCLKVNQPMLSFPEDSHKEVLEAVHYMQALRWVEKTLVPGYEVTPDTVMQLHDILLNGRTGDGRYCGFRNAYLPHKKGCVPAQIPSEIARLCDFINSDLFSPLGQASVAHHAFERIVPFDSMIDRTGLLFAFMPMFRRGLFVDGCVTPICWGASLEKGYRKKLKDASRDDENSESHAFFRERWASYNARNTHMAVIIAESFLANVEALRSKWRSQGMKIPANSASDKLLDLFLAIPSLTARHAAFCIGKGYGTTNEAMHQLVKQGILREKAVDNRERLFVCDQSASVITGIVDELIQMSETVKDEVPEQPL